MRIHKALSLIILSAALPLAAAVYSPWLSVPAGDHPRGLAVGDLDGDTLPELAVANFGAGSFIGQDLPSGSKGSLQVFSPSPSGLRLKAEVDAGPGCRGVAIAPLGLQGGVVLVSVYGEDRLKSFRLKDGNLSQQGAVETAKRPVGVASGTLEPGGKTFAAVACYGDSKVSFFTISAEGTPGERVDVSTGPGPTGVAAGDFDGDHKSDVAVACIGAAKIQVFSQKTGLWALSTTLDLPEGSSPADLKAADLDGDGRTDLAVVLFNQKALAVFIQNPGAGFSPVRTVLTGSDSPNGLAVGVLDKNQGVRVAVAGRDSDRLSIFGIHRGVPEPVENMPVADDSDAHAMGPVEAAILDTNLDSSPDIVVSHLRSNTLRVLTQPPPTENTPTPTPTPTLAATPTHTVTPTAVPGDIQPLSDKTTLAYPNPSSGPVKLRFTLDKPSDVEVRVLDVSGQMVWAFRVPSGETRAGTNETVWQALTRGGAPVASGTYVVKITADGRVVTRKVFIKR